MNIYFYNLEKQTDIQVDLQVEYSTSPNEVYLIRYTEDEECMLDNGKNSPKYGKYSIKKVIQIIGGKFKFGNVTNDVVIAMVIEGNELVPHTISITSSDGYGNWVHSDLYNSEQHFKKHQLIDYSEYKTLAKFFGEEDNSFTGVMKKILEGDVDFFQYLVYNENPKNNDVSKLLTINKFGKYLDYLEKE